MTDHNLTDPVEFERAVDHFRQLRHDRLNSAREEHRLGAAVPWELRQRFIHLSQALALALHRVDDAAQVGTDLPFDLDDRVEAFLAARRAYEEAVAVSRG